MYLKYITGAKKIKIKNKKRIYTSAFESVGIGPFKLYWPNTYSSAFVNAGIGTAYASAFKSAGIGLLNSIDLRPILALSKALV